MNGVLIEQSYQYCKGSMNGGINRTYYKCWKGYINGLLLDQITYIVKDK